MWFIILIIGAIFLGFIISISINPKKTPIVRTKKRSEPQLLSDQIDERLNINRKNSRNATRKKKLRYNLPSSVENKEVSNGSRVEYLRNKVGRYATSSLHESISRTDMVESKKLTGDTYMTKKQLSYYFSHLEGEMFTDYLLAPYDNSLIKVNELEFATMLKKKTDSDSLEKALRDTASNNNEGVAYEKAGDITNAIAIYEKNLEIAYPALHSYERLMILYRREKRYEDEIRVIKKALIDFSIKSHKTHIEKWKNRLQKARQLNLNK